MCSLVVIDLALQDFSFKASTISLLNSIKTSSTTFIVSLFVTLKPFIKVLSIFNSFNFILILFPPPCTITGVNPSFFMMTTSDIKRLKRLGSIKTLPPHFITIFSSLYFFRYFLTSLMERPFEGKIFSKFTSSLAVI